MRTYSGRFLDPFDLKQKDIDIVDIAHHLSHICRFNGATRYHYSVAQHSVLVAAHMKHELRLSRPDELLQGLLHDASEAYLCDIPRPIKHTPEFTFYREMEENVMMVIAQFFSLDWPFVAEVKKADDAVLVAEGLELMNHVYSGFGLPSSQKIYSLSPEEAEEEFLGAFREYTKLRACNAQVFGV